MDDDTPDLLQPPDVRVHQKQDVRLNAALHNKENLVEEEDNTLQWKINKIKYPKVIHSEYQEKVKPKAERKQYVRTKG